MHSKGILKKITAVIFFVLSVQAPSAVANLLSFDLTATHEYTLHFETNRVTGEETFDYPRTSIPSSNFSISYDVNLAPEFERGVVGGNYYEYTRDNKHYSIYTNVFNITPISAFTPFSDSLMAFPSDFGNDHVQIFDRYFELAFESRVVSDAVTGEILFDDSRQGFRVINQLQISNITKQKDYFHNITIFMGMEKDFLPTKAKKFTNAELNSFLAAPQGFKSMWFDEGFGAAESSADFFSENYRGYLGDASHTYAVPEPHTLILFLFAALALAARRKQVEL